MGNNCCAGNTSKSGRERVVQYSGHSAIDQIKKLNDFILSNRSETHASIPHDTSSKNQTKRMFKNLAEFRAIEKAVSPINSTRDQCSSPLIKKEEIQDFFVIPHSL